MTGVQQMLGCRCYCGIIWRCVDTIVGHDAARRRHTHTHTHTHTAREPREGKRERERNSGMNRTCRRCECQRRRSCTEGADIKQIQGTYTFISPLLLPCVSRHVHFSSPLVTTLSFNISRNTRLRLKALRNNTVNKDHQSKNLGG